MRKSNFNGFTLAEILVTIGVASVILLILTEIFFSSLRGGTKSQLLTILDQTGKSILDNMDKNIRNSELVMCPQFTDNPSMAIGNSLVIFRNGEYIRYRYIEGDENFAGSIKRDIPVPNGTDEQQNPDVFARTVCDSELTDYIDSLIVLTDNNLRTTDNKLRTGVEVFPPDGGAVFTRTKALGSNKDSVSVKFKLAPVNQAGLKIPGQIDPVLFSTTIELR